MSTTITRDFFFVMFQSTKTITRLYNDENHEVVLLAGTLRIYMKGNGAMEII